MVNKNSFTGFSKESMIFFEELAANNNRAWFESHRDEYENHVLNPSRVFVSEMGDLLKQLSPGIQAVPRVNKSLFKIHRDTRFSKDKRPYKTNMALWFWEGTGTRMECSGFYFHLEPGRLILGTGIYKFPKEIMKRYREAVAESAAGDELRNIVSGLKKKEYKIGIVHYKKVPRGYDRDHKHAPLLLHSGLIGSREMPVPDEAHSNVLIDFCYGTYREMNPLHQWLVRLTEE